MRKSKRYLAMILGFGSIACFIIALPVVFGLWAQAKLTHFAEDISHLESLEMVIDKFSLGYFSSTAESTLVVRDEKIFQELLSRYDLDPSTKMIELKLVHEIQHGPLFLKATTEEKLGVAKMRTIWDPVKSKPALRMEKQNIHPVYTLDSLIRLSGSQHHEFSGTRFSLLVANNAKITCEPARTAFDYDPVASTAALSVNVAELLMTTKDSTVVLKNLQYRADYTQHHEHFWIPVNTNAGIESIAVKTPDLRVEVLGLRENSVCVFEKDNKENLECKQNMNLAEIAWKDKQYGPLEMNIDWRHFDAHMASVHEIFSATKTDNQKKEDFLRMLSRGLEIDLKNSFLKTSLGEVAFNGGLVIKPDQYTENNIMEKIKNITLKFAVQFPKELLREIMLIEAQEELKNKDPQNPLEDPTSSVDARLEAAIQQGDFMQKGSDLVVDFTWEDGAAIVNGVPR